MRRLLFTLFILFVQCLAFAQTENKIWYFGENAGLDFNFEPPKALTNGMMTVDEGCGVVCNPEGELQFYTNGLMIFNRKFDPMLGNMLFGHSSATQKGVACAYIGDSTKCYVFTTGAQESGCREGFNYSIVDMSLNDGYGDVISSNNMLLERGSEKIAIAEHANGTDKWVVTHDFLENRIAAWPITKDGIGQVINSALEYEFNLNYTWNRAGYMTFSRDFTKMAMALYFDGIVLLYDFDNSSGLFSNPIILDIEDGQGQYCYGVEFSPDGSKLYCTKRGRAPSRLFQYDISLESEEDIKASRVMIAENDGNEFMDYFCALMLGPDNKIYVASENNDYLHRIENPDALGQNCDFVENAIYLEGRKSLKGLPTRAQAISFSTDTSSTGPDDTTTVVGLNPEFHIECNSKITYKPGKRISIPYTIEYSDDVLKSGDVSGYVEALIRFDRFLLFPDDTKLTNRTEEGDYSLAILKENISENATYSKEDDIDFYVGLGKKETTEIEIISLTINGIEYNIDTLKTSDGCVYVEVCDAGGKRLINPESEADIILKANPVNDNAEMEVWLIENGMTSVQLFDFAGQYIDTILDRDVYGENYLEISYSTKELHSGLYFLRLITPTISKVVLLRIIK
jgi:hypothetical protein